MDDAAPHDTTTARVKALVEEDVCVRPELPPPSVVAAVGALGVVAASLVVAGPAAAVEAGPAPLAALAATGVLGMLLGLRHALEPDHLLAVSTFVGRERSTREATRLGVSWGVGHTAAILAVGGAATALHQGLPPGVSASLEVVVAVVLLGLGARALMDGWRLGRGGPVRQHQHGDITHAHGGAVEHLHLGGLTLARRPLAVGALHGLAGSGALTAVVMASLPTPATQVAGLLLFGAGSTVGMAVLAACAGWPLARLVHRPAVAAGFSGVAGALSMAYAVVLGGPILYGWFA